MTDCVWDFSVIWEKADTSDLKPAQHWQVSFWLSQLKERGAGRNFLLVTEILVLRSFFFSQGKIRHWEVHNGWAVISPGDRVHLSCTSPAANWAFTAQQPKAKRPSCNFHRDYKKKRQRIPRVCCQEYFYSQCFFWWPTWEKKTSAQRTDVCLLIWGWLNCWS